MKKKKIIFVLSIVAVFWGVGYASGIDFHGNVANSVYSYEDTTSHTRVYQFVQFSFESPEIKNLSLNASLRALTDVNETLDSEDRFKAYNLNLKFKKLFNRLDVVLGRQFLHPGTILGGLDGLYTKFYISKNINFSVYGGTEANFNSSLKIYKPEDSFVTGGLFELNRIYSSKFQFFYLQKANENDIFWHLTGLNFQNSSIPETNIRLQTHYDLENSRLHRLLVYARHNMNKKLSFSFGFKNQYPQVYTNSFFTIFEINAYSQYKLGCSYKIANNYLLSGQYQLVQFEDENNANRFFATISNSNGSIGLIYESGYAGEQLGVIFDYAYEITPALLASLNIDYSRYKMEKVYEFENQVANAVRLSYRFLSHWSIDLEYQWLTNRFKDSDSRVLNHIRFKW